jgi:uncharacterized damage-inducible protein DinB
MNPSAILRRLESLPQAIEGLTARLTPEEWRWRPPTRGWSVLEVVHHLLHEEGADFRARLRSTLEDPAREWLPLDPEKAVVEGRFQEADPAAVTAALREERARSMSWLRSLRAPDWDVRRESKGRVVTAGDLLASWLAHDARHLGQVAKRLYEMAAHDATPHSVEYAG